MSSYLGFAAATPAHQTMREVVRGQIADARSTTTYYYRTALGADGSTTDPDAIPAGAIVEQVVTT